MWLNVIKAKLNAKQCWPVVLHMVGSWGARGFVQGLCSLQCGLLRSNHFTHFVDAQHFLVFAISCVFEWLKGKNLPA